MDKLNGYEARVNGLGISKHIISLEEWAVDKGGRCTHRWISAAVSRAPDLYCATKRDKHGVETLIITGSDRIRPSLCMARRSRGWRWLACSLPLRMFDARLFDFPPILQIDHLRILPLPRHRAVATGFTPDGGHKPYRRLTYVVSLSACGLCRLGERSGMGDWASS